MDQNDIREENTYGAEAPMHDGNSEGAGYGGSSARNNNNSSWNSSYAYSYQPDDQDTKKPVKKKKEKKKRNGLPALAVIAISLVCAILGGLGGGFFAAKQSKKPEEKFPEEEPEVMESTVYSTERTPSKIRNVNVKGGEKLDPTEVYAQYVNATVGIQTEITTNYFGYTTKSAASGSGFILTEDGYIITNHHVIDKASSVSVMTYDGKSYDAKIIGYDEDNDVAVLKIEAEGLSTVVLGSSDDLLVGEEVMTIGNPLGELTFSLTHGHVSALNREVTFGNDKTMNLIQTDCAINLGNSGGPFFNAYGEVVGIVNSKMSSSSYSSTATIDNLGFAIPIDDVRANIFSIIENGYFVKPYIGITVGTVSSDMINYGIPTGAIIRTVVEGGPAEAAGLKENDIITAIDENTIISSSELISEISRKKIGETVSLSVYRDSANIKVDVVIGENQRAALPEEKEEPEENNTQGYEQQGQQPFNIGDFPWNLFGFGY